MKRFFKSRKGFTLVELMIVVAIIGILAGIAIPRYINFIRRSREASTKANLGAIRSALTIYYSDQEGIYPSRAGIITVPFIGTGANNYIDDVPSGNEDCGSHPRSAPQQKDVENDLTLGNTGDQAASKAWAYLTDVAAYVRVARFVSNCTLTDTKGTTVSTW